MKKSLFISLAAIVLSAMILSACGSKDAADSTVSSEAANTAAVTQSSVTTSSTAVETSQTTEAKAEVKIDITTALPRVDVLTYKMGVKKDTEPMTLTVDECEQIFSNNKTWVRSKTCEIMYFAEDGLVYDYCDTWKNGISDRKTGDKWAYDTDRKCIVISREDGTTQSYGFYQKNGVVCLGCYNTLYDMPFEYYPIDDDTLIFEKPDTASLTDIVGEWNQGDGKCVFYEDGTAKQYEAGSDYVYWEFDWFMPSKDAIYIYYHKMNSGEPEYWAKYSLTLTESAATIIFPYHQDATPFFALTK